MTEENRDFLRRISVDAEPEMQIFDSITSAFKFCFSLGVASDERSKPSGTLASLAPRQFLPEDYLEALLPISEKEKLSLGQVASQFGDAGIRRLRTELDKSSGPIMSNLKID